MTLQFRRAEAADAEAIADLVNSAYRGESSKKGWTTEADLLGGQRTDAQAVREAIQKRGQLFLLAVQGTTIVASVFLERKDLGVAYLGMLTVQPQMQAAGLGRKLLAAAENFASEHWSSKQMEMTVITLRTELIEWYQRRGYQRTGRSVDFPYGDERFGQPKRDDLVMEVLTKKL